MRNTKEVGGFLLLILISANAWAGFLDMPEIEEVPEAENEILLKDLDVPPVRDRNPDPQAGPRLNVTAFRVQGIVEFPELGITRQKLIELVESSRYNIMKEGELLYSGYTPEELSELQDLIVDIEKETRDEHVGPLDVQRLVFLIRDQRRRRGVTLGMLEDVADKVTNYYRERGFILAKAFIPEQHVRDGVVTLTLLLGDLGRVEFVGNKRYSENVVERVFADALHKPVTTELMEEKLYYLNDMPGLSVQGFFGPGEQVGDTKLSVRTLNESAYDLNFRLDNHGSDATGEYRLYGDVIYNNPLKYGDRIHLSLLVAREPNSAEFGSLRYDGPLFTHKLRYNISATQNAFVTGLEQESRNSRSVLEITGKTQTFGTGLSYQIERSRVHNSYLNFTVSNVNAEVDDGRSGVNVDSVNNLVLSYGFDLLSEKARVIHNAVFSLKGSLIDEINRNEVVQEGQQIIFEDALIVSLDYNSVKFLKPMFGLHGTRWKLRASGQYSGKRLSSVNQYSLTGPTMARAFKTNTFFGDNGLYLSSELLFESPDWLGRKARIEPYAFVDASYGQAFTSERDNTGALFDVKRTARFYDVGLGLKLSTSMGLKANLSIANPIKTQISSDLDIEDNEDVKAYFDIQYSL